LRMREKGGMGWTGGKGRTSTPILTYDRQS